MLPFLKSKKNQNITVYKSDEAGSKQEEAPVSDRLAAADALIQAIHAKDAAKVCEALEQLEANDE